MKMSSTKRTYLMWLEVAIYPADIAVGKRWDSENSPLAYAIRRALQLRDVEVEVVMATHSQILVFREGKMYNIPVDAARDPKKGLVGGADLVEFNFNFDHGRHVAPLAFRADFPEEIFQEFGRKV